MKGPIHKNDKYCQHCGVKDATAKKRPSGRILCNTCVREGKK